MQPSQKKSSPPSSPPLSTPRKNRRYLHGYAYFENLQLFPDHTRLLKHSRAQVGCKTHSVNSRKIHVESPPKGRFHHMSSTTISGSEHEGMLSRTLPSHGVSMVLHRERDACRTTEGSNIRECPAPAFPDQNYNVVSKYSYRSTVSSSHPSQFHPH